MKKTTTGGEVAEQLERRESVVPAACSYCGRLWLGSQQSVWFTTNLQLQHQGTSDFHRNGLCLCT